VERPVRRCLDPQSQPVAHILLQPDQVQQRRTWGELDEKIEIARHLRPPRMLRPRTLPTLALVLAAAIARTAWGPTAGPTLAQAEPPTTHAGDGALPADGETIAYFVGGWFWCTEADFAKLPGVLDVRSGYLGGASANPTYAQVSRNDTGHREVVEVLFDPAVVTCQQLLDAFRRLHDPSDAGGSFVDRGFS